MERVRTKKSAVPQTDVFTALCKQELGETVYKEFRFCQKRKWRFDYALPNHRVALEVEGGVWTQGRHTRPKGFLGDIEKYNTATMLGWRVLRTTPSKLCSAETIKMLKIVIN